MFDCLLAPELMPHYRKLPQRAQKKMEAAVKLFRRDNAYPSPGFNPLFRTSRGMLYSLRVDGNRPPAYRILGYAVEPEMLHWYWVGPHDAYERLLAA